MPRRILTRFAPRLVRGDADAENYPEVSLLDAPEGVSPRIAEAVLSIEVDGDVWHIPASELRKALAGPHWIE